MRTDKNNNFKFTTKFLMTLERSYIGYLGFLVIDFLKSVFPFSGHEPIYFTENKEKTLRVSYNRDTHTIEYMN